ncbi:L-threonylcarbamoyladenylate synthase [Desulfobulbus alkaliphilus]|uniref:L-threonylcarbamoyladenylate synthase n=1 Tax=Desulfobulbus alkaliphilus TaxID=869814 RepID=UPI001963C61E|nr:threonylcarbamoyl-AMP synthase [Desulfobulbus alkaliphilus]
MSRIAAVNGASLRRAADIIRNGGLVAFPTETYYGLAVDPWQSHALERLFQVKRRRKELPILVLVSGTDQLPLLAQEIPLIFKWLIERFWPGPLTLVFPARPALSPLLTGMTGTVGLRQSPDETAHLLIRTFGGPITATSANISGSTAAVTAEDVAQMFVDEIDLILDGGTTPGGKASTLVGSEGTSLRCLREGAIPFADVQACLAAADPVVDW